MKRLLKKLIIIFITFGCRCKLFDTNSMLSNAYTGYLKLRLEINKIYWPRDKTCLISHLRKIYVSMNSWIGRPSSYIQGAGEVYIVNYVRFNPNSGANSVVTKSFPEGYCMIAGNPAKVIKCIDKEKVVISYNQTEHYGYIPKEKFEKVIHKYLDI